MTVFVSVPFTPHDRAAFARAAHDKDMTPSEFLHCLAIQWLELHKLRTAYPETTRTDAQRRSTRRRRDNVPSVDPRQCVLDL